MSSLAAAIMYVLVVTPQAERPCKLVFGCGDYAVMIADVAEKASTYADDPKIGPWMLVAIALTESRFDRSRHGWRGQGLVGLNPRSPQYAYALSVCHQNQRECLQTQFTIAAAYLSYERKRCGSVAGALRSYGGGGCDGPAEDPDKYLRQFRHALRRLGWKGRGGS